MIIKAIDRTIFLISYAASCCACLAIYTLAMLINLHGIDTDLLGINFFRIASLSMIPALAAGHIKITNTFVARIAGAAVGFFGGPFLAYVIIRILYT